MGQPLYSVHMLDETHFEWDSPCVDPSDKTILIGKHTLNGSVPLLCRPVDETHFEWDNPFVVPLDKTHFEWVSPFTLSTCWTKHILNGTSPL